MALIQCPECGTEVSEAAAACPKCGHPLKATPAGGVNPRDPVHLIGIILGAIILIGLVLFGVQQPRGSRKVPFRNTKPQHWERWGFVV